MYRHFFKRLFDICLSFMGLVVLLPVWVIVAIIIKVDSKGPVLFKQLRYGKDKKLFTIHKFRSMKVNAPSDLATRDVANPDELITKVGKFIRKTSIDELPQIWDIFVGNMSIIGPRPVIEKESDLIEEREKYNANSVRPGLSGLAQISGRDVLGVEEKARLDGEYVENVSLAMDVKCFIGTILKVLKRDGIVEGDAPELHASEVVITEVDEIEELENSRNIEVA